MSKGTFVLTPFPFTDLSGNKVRPALILHAHKNSDDCVVAFVSSVEQKTGLYDVVINTSKENGLKANSVVKINKLATLQKKVILGELGIIGNNDLKKIDEMIRKVFQI